jgi:hypothetical protein
MNRRQIAKEIAAAVEQMLLEQVLDAARLQRAGSGVASRRLRDNRCLRDDLNGALAPAIRKCRGLDRVQSWPSVVSHIRTQPFVAVGAERVTAAIDIAARKA